MAEAKIVVPKKDWRVLIHQVLRVGDNLDFEFRRQAFLMARAGYFHAQARNRVRILKQQLEVLSARLRKRIRLAEGELTKDEMHYAVERRKVYQAKQRELNDAIYQEDLLKGLITALDHKKDCLVQIGAASRVQLNDELRALAKDLEKKVR